MGRAYFFARQVANHAVLPLTSRCGPCRVPTTTKGNPNVSILASSLALGAADYDWRDDAVCRDTDPALFFPVGTTGNALVQIDHAKRTCGECQVAQECLDFALDTNQDSGIWGGLTEEERRVIRRERVAALRAQRRAAATA
jgi:WhiB family redox-sensing transcriptional regulator